MLRIIGCTHVDGRKICSACLHFNVIEAITSHPKSSAAHDAAHRISAPVVNIQLGEAN